MGEWDTVTLAGLDMVVKSDTTFNFHSTMIVNGTCETIPRIFVHDSAQRRLHVRVVAVVYSCYVVF